MKGIRHMGQDDQDRRFGQRRANGLATGCLVVFLSVASTVCGQSGGIAAAYVQGDSIWTSAFENAAKPSIDPSFHDPSFTGAPDWVLIERRDFRGRRQAVYRLLTTGYRDAQTPLRWHLACDALWVAGQKAYSRRTPPGLRVPLSKLESFDRDLKAMERNPNRDMSELVAARLKSINNGEPRNRDDENPAIRYLWPMFPWTYLDGTHDLQFDVLPTSHDSCIVFYRLGSEIRAYNAKGEAEYKEVDHFDVDFKEWFRVFGITRAWYFLTESGMLYEVKKDINKKQSPRMIWGKTDSPIIAAVTDVDAGNTFFATAPPQTGLTKILRLEKDGGITELGFDSAKLKPIDASKPLEACIPFVQFLHAEGLLGKKKP